MRIVLTFLAGCFFGALALFVYLQESGSLRSGYGLRSLMTSSSADVQGTPAAVPGEGTAGQTIPGTPPSAPVVLPPAPVQAVARPEQAPSSPAATVDVPTVAPGVASSQIQPVLLPGSMVIPVAGIGRDQLRGNFLQARGGRVHNALDIMAPRGTPVVAAVDGTIRKLFFSRAGGITIYQFDPAGELVYYYAHLDRYASGITEKQFVRRGTVLGYVGISGNANPTGPHLHFAISRLTPSKEWWKGTPIDPYPILIQRGVTVK